MFGRHYKGNRDELITTETLNEPGNIQIYALFIKVLLLFSQHKENMTFLDRLDVHPRYTSIKQVQLELMGMALVWQVSDHK